MKKSALIVFAASTLLSSCGVAIVPAEHLSSLSGNSSSETISSESSSSSAQSLSEESSATPDEPIDSANNGAFYQLLVYSFADGNGDGIGDFKGIIDHLDYLSNLGIKGIWLSPINEMKSYHGYNVVDYSLVASKYEVSVDGVKYDLPALVNAAHKKGIKIIMDMVLNHTADTNPWYKAHPNWYSGDDAFGGDMKDLDYDVPAVREAIKESCGKYLKLGVDGFRLDAALWIYNSKGMKSHDDSKTIAWWKEFAGAMRAINKDAYIIGEVLSEDTPSCARDFNAGDIETFDFEQKGNLLNMLRYGKASEYVANTVEYKNAILSKRGSALGAPTLSNHDIGRFNQLYNIDTEADLRFALASHLLAPGTPYLYYGEELGLEGNCPSGYADMGYRTPMPFASEVTDGTKYFERFHGDGKTVNVTFSGKTADQDAADSSSLYSLTADILRFRNAHDVFTTGENLKAIASPVASLGAYEISNEFEKFSVFFNSTEENIRVKLSNAEGYAFAKGIGANSSSYSQSSNEISIGAKSIAVLSGKGAAISSTTAKAVDAKVPVDTGAEVTAEKEGKLQIHFLNKSNWSKVNYWAWIKNGPNYSGGKWPGLAMSKDGDGTYSVSIPHGATNIIFNDGSSQTADLSLNKPGEYWYDDGARLWYNVDPR